MSGQLQASNIIKTWNRKIPCEGPVAVPLLLDFTTQTEQDLNMLLQQQTNRISLVQTIWVDMSIAAVADLTILVGPTTINQKLLAKKATQGYYPILCPNPVEIIFQVPSTGDIIPVIPTNISIAGVVWSV